VRKFILLFFLIFFMGCSQNPLEPLPPIEHQAYSFEEHLERLQTPSHTYFWVKQFTEYDMRGQLGWDWIDRGMPDLAYSLAYSMWETYIKGHNAGVCGQFASTFVVAARTHGYEAGFLLTYTKYSGHARGWIVEKDGSISVSDNQLYFKKYYKNKQDMINKFSENYFNKKDRCGWITNDKMENIFDERGFHNPETTWSVDLNTLAIMLGYSGI
jgi:hypothetical protein